jgi:multidrug efflux system membrane fusion protein
MANKRAAVFALLLLVLGAASAVFVMHRRERSKAEESRGAPGTADTASKERPVPVLATTVERRDVPIDLEGIGSVVAAKTVTVKSQVDGVLQQVFYQEGQHVKVGDLLAQIDPRPYLIQLHQAQGNLTRDEALLEGTRLNVERYTALADEKYVARQQLTDARGLLGQYQGAVQVDRAAVESAKLNLTYARITSPIDGVTGVRVVDPGNFVRSTDTTGLVVITQLDPIAVLFTLPQDDLPKLTPYMGGREPLKVDAYDRDGRTKLASGELLLVDNQINQSTATIRLKAYFANAEHRLWPNQFVKALLHVSVERDVLVLPTVAVQRGPHGTFAYVIKPDRTVEARPIEVRLSLSDVSVIERGAVAGEHVVVEGQDRLRPGLKVHVRTAAEDGDDSSSTQPGSLP